MHEAFEWDINCYIYFGGYSGGTILVDNKPRWDNK